MLAGHLGLPLLVARIIYPILEYAQTNRFPLVDVQVLFAHPSFVNK